MQFKAVTRLNAILFAFLSLGLLVSPSFVVDGFGLDPSVGAEVMARRSGMIFAGVAPMLLSVSGISDTSLQQAVARSALILAAGLAVLGIVEWSAGRVGPGIMGAVGIELVFATLYAPMALRQSA